GPSQATPSAIHLVVDDVSEEAFHRDEAGATCINQTPGRRFSAASTVWAISVAMVIGPTPPGTGVYAAHLSITADSSTSPIPPEWKPASTTIAPFLIQEP